MSESLNDLQYKYYSNDTFSGTSALTIGGTVVPGTMASTIGGRIQGISMGMGTMTGTGTVVLDLVDSLGATIASGTQAESGTSYFGTLVPVNTTMNWVVTPAGTQEGTASFYFNVHYKG